MLLIRAIMLNYAHIYLATIYAQNYAGIIRQGLALVKCG